MIQLEAFYEMFKKDSDWSVAYIFGNRIWAPSRHEVCSIYAITAIPPVAAANYTHIHSSMVHIQHEKIQHFLFSSFQFTLATRRTISNIISITRQKCMMNYFSLCKMRKTINHLKEYCVAVEKTHGYGSMYQ